MSKLEAIKGKAIHEDIEYYARGFEPGEVDDTINSLLNTEYYLKSEADKVIAEKDKQIAELKEKVDLYKRGWRENDRINAWLYKWHKRWLKLAEKYK